MDSELIEYLAEAVHEAWMEESARQGRIAPGVEECPQCGRRLEEVPNYFESKGKHLLCRYCSRHYFEHSGMVPYHELTESAKEYDRITAKAVLRALERLRGEVLC